MVARWAAKEDRVLPRLLRRRASARPGAPFLRIEDRPAETFGQVLAAAERIAGQLAGLGVARGDLVPLLAETSAPSVHAWLGVNLAGAADVPVQDCAAVGVASSFENDDDIKLCGVPVPGPGPGEGGPDEAGPGNGGPGNGGLDEADLIRHLARVLPHYLVPRYIEMLPELPRTPTGKIQRQALRASGTGPGVWDRVAAGVSVRALSSPPGTSEGDQ